MPKNDLKRDKRFQKHLAREFQVEQPPESYLKAVRATLDDLPDELPVKRRPFYQSALRACVAFAVCLVVAAVGAYGAYLANPVFMESLPGVGQIFQQLDREDQEQPTPSPAPWDGESHVEQEVLEEIPAFEPQTMEGGGGILTVENAWCDGIYLHLDVSLELASQAGYYLSTCTDPNDSSTNTLEVYVDDRPVEMQTTGDSAFFFQDTENGRYNASWTFRLTENYNHGDGINILLKMPCLINLDSGVDEESTLSTDIYGCFSMMVDTSRSLIQDLEVEDNGVTLERVEATPTCVTIQAAVPEFGSLLSTMIVPFSQLDSTTQRLGYYGQLTTPEGEILSDAPYPFASPVSYPELPADDGFYHVTYAFKSIPEGVDQAIFTLYEYSPTMTSYIEENPQNNRVTAEFTIDLKEKRVYPSQNYLSAGRKKLDYRISASLDRSPDPVNGYICSMPDTSGNYVTWSLYTRDTEYRPVELRRYENEELISIYASVPEEEYNAYSEGFGIYQNEQYQFLESQLDNAAMGGTWNALTFQLYDMENTSSYDSPTTRYELVDSETGEVLIQNVFRTFCQQYDQVFGTQMEASYFGEDSTGEVSELEQTADEMGTASPQPH